VLRLVGRDEACREREQALRKLGGAVGKFGR